MDLNGDFKTMIETRIDGFTHYALRIKLKK